MKTISAAVLFWLALTGAVTSRAQSQAVNSSAYSPTYLILDKPGPVNRVRFYPGEKLRFRLHDEPGRYVGKLEGVTPRSILMYESEIPLRDIKSITYQKNGAWAGFARLSHGSLLSGSVTLALIGSINYFSRKYRHDPTLLKLSPVALGLSFAIKPVYQRTYRINNKRRLRTI
jgi:hypothetical protein